MNHYAWAALNGMDRRLVELVDRKRGGRFLEIGANDGLQQSNTLALERFYGWSGILVEANPVLAGECARNRPAAQVVCVAAGGMSGVVRIGDDDLVSRVAVDGGMIVGQVTLSMIIDAVGGGRLDVMIIDVEGRELDVLQGLDLSRHRPTYLLIETSVPNEVARLLRPHYEWRDQWSHHDYLFILDEALRS